MTYKPLLLNALRQKVPCQGTWRASRLGGQLPLLITRLFVITQLWNARPSETPLLHGMTRTSAFFATFPQVCANGTPIPPDKRVGGAHPMASRAA